MTRRERGIAAYARIFGVPEADLPELFGERVGTAFAEEAVQAAGGPTWSDPALTDRERGIAIITALVAQGVTGDRLATHVRLARQNGLDHNALTALLLLLAGYLGYPRASLAMETINNLDLPSVARVLAATAASGEAPAGAADEPVAEMGDDDIDDLEALDAEDDFYADALEDV